MLKSILLAVFLGLCLSSAATAQTRVNGYYRSNGTYVAPHYRSYSDGNFYNNWSTYPNVNPYNGSTGSRYYPSTTPSYSTPSYTAPSYSSPYGGNFYNNNYYRNNYYGY